MREIYKNPIFYYVLIPALVGLWPLLVGAHYLRQAEDSRDNEAALCVEGQSNIIQILTLDPERATVKEPNQVAVEFAYSTAVGQVASIHKIPSSKWTPSAGNIMTSGGKKRQDAIVKLTEVGIVDIAKFLTTIQSMYVNLTCDSAKLQKRRGELDKWDVSFSFQYYF
ncbi:MAG: hypothetical protein MUC88_11385 [Planctomycetes bacterium]|jgi:hypothetical protein|nr:hypothetical protein [Planctomycetota bacterium]